MTKPRKTHCKWGHLSAYFSRPDKDGHNYCALCMTIRNLHNNGRQNPATGPARAALTCKINMAKTVKKKDLTDNRAIYRYKKPELTKKQEAHAEWLKIHGNRKIFIPTINPPIL